jgi:hypothetical protein
MKIFIFILLAAVFFFKPFPVQATGLSVDIVNASFVTVESPAVTMDPVQFSVVCQTATGTLGTTTQQIYVNNNDDADGGWDVSLAAANVTDLWTSGGNTYDFNDSTDSGCTNGQMTVDPSGLTPTKGQCTSCDADYVTVPGTSAAFVQGTVNSITILSGAAESDDIGDWTLQGVSISQKIPAEKPIGSYSINMVLTIAAK